MAKQKVLLEITPTMALDPSLITAIRGVKSKPSPFGQAGVFGSASSPAEVIVHFGQYSIFPIPSTDATVEAETAALIKKVNATRK